MDFKIILLAFGIALGSCADVKNSSDGVDNSWKGENTLSLTFQTHRPYCGGAAPNEDQINGFIEPLANELFYIYKDERPTSVAKMIKVTSDAEGKFRIDLQNGLYSVIRADKSLSLDAFIAKKKIDGQFYTYSDDACFETWRTTPDFTIDLASPADEVVTISKTCFTGDNPCMQYTGPYPP